MRCSTHPYWRTSGTGSPHRPPWASRCPARARTRYHQPERPATATLLPDGRVRVDFAAPQRAIAPGQAVVLYNGESVIGGGTILNVE